MTTIAINPHKIPFRTSQSKTDGSPDSSIYNQAVNTAGKVAEHGVGLFAPTAEIISGAVALFLGLVSEYVLKDSILDKMSKVISFLGLGSIAVGGWGLFKYIKKQTTPPQALPTGIEPSNAAAVKNAELAVTQIDKAFSRGYDGANTGAVFAGNQTDATLQSSAKSLLDLYLSPEVISIVKSHSIGPEPLITGISDTPVTVKDLKERIAALSAFVKTPGVKILGDVDVLPNYHRVLPDDFINAYILGKTFEKNYKENADFAKVTNLPLTSDSLKVLNTSFTQAGAKVEAENLNTLQFTLDNLEALKKTINTLVSSSSTDPKTLRNISVVKQGLVCAFGFEGIDGKDINGKLIEVLKVNIEPRLAAIKTKFESLKPVLDESKFPLQKRELTTVAFNETIRDIKQSEFILRTTST